MHEEELTMTVHAKLPGIAATFVELPS